MTNSFKLFCCFISMVGAVALVACGGGSTAPSCTTLADCASGTVCIGAGSGASACLPDCSVSTTECSASASCTGVGSTSVSICQEAEEEEQSSGGETAAPEPQEEPRIPCTTDAECNTLQAGLICAEFQGMKDCTIPCSQESDCDMPSVGGMSIDFMTCIDDEGDSSRQACLPDVACFNDPMSCITMPDGMDDMGGMDDMDDMDDFDDFDDMD
ncbi:MAG: hypothetical protein HOK97_11005 [Deltaproteobacteria bacterium]|nr:hypothetical protein [Deltaproteobacteria bacterium]MBT6490282.1 hypothetical protein [Deltaproteobacteria bacterium]